MDRGEGAVGNQMTAFPNAVYVVAAGIVVPRTGVMPRWVAHGAFAVAVIHLLSTASLAREGAFAPSGTLPSLAPLAHAMWLVSVAWVLRAPGSRGRRRADAEA